MRLAQIARKVGMTPTDIKRFLESEFELQIGKDVNYKLDDDHIKAVIDRFDVVAEQLVPETMAESEIAAKTETNVLVDPEQVTEVKLETNFLVEDELEAEFAEETELEHARVEEHDNANDAIEVAELNTNAVEIVEINYNDPETELTNENGKFEPLPVDPNAALIKASTVKLDGLKILGKIELPQTKVAEPVLTPEEIEAREAEAIAALDAAMQSQVQDVIKVDKIIAKPQATQTQAPREEFAEYDSEFKDEDGIYHFSPSQRANRAKALVHIELKNRTEVEKEKKKRHYAELMADKSKPKKPTESVKKIPKSKPQIEKPKTKQKTSPPKGLWGKFVHWLND